MGADLLAAIEACADAAGHALPPGWADTCDTAALPEGPAALEALRAALDWSPPQAITGRPRPDEFPLLVHDPAEGWRAARQWIGEDAVALVTGGTLAYDADRQAWFRLAFADPLGEEEPSAFAVFARAIRRRSRALLLAGLATIFANILTLATSLYAMQLYDRVIPLASFETLVVLTLGVLFALLLDLALRSLRGVLIEAEAQAIDREVSEFFFARAQAIRLDARPGGIGTMAAQIQGQEQIRQVMSASSLFVLTDLPFALLFIIVVASIGGAVALVPLVSFPVAIAMALLFARIIRKGAERAQVTGTRKNGMLVEMLDASETLKANLGGWHMLARWNRLIREIHHYEDPVKRAAAVSGSLFSTMQQVTYTAVLCLGAYLAATGSITTGALLACSIIVGRINGPLIAQLPGLIVQWGYARSSLKGLDMLMQHPVEKTASRGGLRPGRLAGPLALTEVRFAYRGAGGEAVAIERLAFRPGEKVALLGGVGAGKSTLLKLLAGLYTPITGTITLGGLDLAQVAEETLRRNIGYLSQNARLVRGTLRDSLTMGLGGVSDDDLLAVAQATGLDALFAGGSRGLDSEVQEGGAGLSGGQRALVALNRLIHAAPSVWLLDEPTAALDAASEKAVLDAVMARIGKDGILVMATHKLPLVERFDRVVVMARGTVVSSEPAEEFLRKIREFSAPARAAGESFVSTRLGGGGAS
ncbi:MAG: ATP-binding cassette domain-containing protein [Porphyrobacter sp.]|nr:ATP-binding cassette domain-containing protein [Porphyrobacter sp.]